MEAQARQCRHTASSHLATRLSEGRQWAAWESAWRSGSFPPTLARGWNRRRSGWRGRQNYFSKPHLRSLFKLPPPNKIYLSLNYVQSFYKFHFACYDQRFKTSKHTGCGEAQCQCCQLSGPTSHVFWNMTLCHKVSGSRRFGVPSPSRANSLLGPPD